MRLGLGRIIRQWEALDDFEAITAKIKEVTAWIKENPPIEQDEEAVIRKMMEKQIRFGFQRAGFTDLINRDSQDGQEANSTA